MQLISRKGFLGLSDEFARAALEPGRFARVASQRCASKVGVAGTRGTGCGLQLGDGRRTKTTTPTIIKAPPRPVRGNTVATRAERVYAAYTRRATKVIATNSPRNLT